MADLRGIAVIARARLPTGMKGGVCVWGGYRRDEEEGPDGTSPRSQPATAPRSKPATRSPGNHQQGEGCCGGAAPEDDREPAAEEGVRELPMAKPTAGNVIDAHSHIWTRAVDSFPLASGAPDYVGSTVSCSPLDPVLLPSKRRQ